MAEEQQSSQQAPSLPTAEETSAVSTSKETEPAAPTARKNTGLWLFTLVNFLLIIAAAYGGYWYVNQYTVTQSKLDSLNATVSDSLNSHKVNTTTAIQAVESSVATEAANLDALELGESQQQEQLALLNNQLQSALAQIQELEGRRPTDWLVAEADYLVRMAGRKMWLEQDLRSAIMLLGNADMRLESLADPSVLPVRALIAQDIQLLQQVNPVSEVSVALALDGLIKQVDNLAIITPKEANTIAPQQVSDSANDWKANLLAVWHSIADDFIRVEYRDTPIEPMMTTEQQWISREQIKLALQQAQVAALATEQTLYVAAIERAETVLLADYILDNADVSGFLTVLTQLKGTDISRDIPTQLESQSALEALLDSRVKRVFGEGASAL